MQKRATRLQKDLKDLNYNERLVQLVLPSLSYRRNRAQTYKLINDIDQTASNLSSHNNNTTRGHKYQLFKFRER